MMKKALTSFLAVIALAAIPQAAQVNLSNTPSRLSEYPFVMPFGDNKVMVVWDEKEGFYNLFYRVFANGSWGPKTRIYSTSMDSQWPQLARDGNDRIHMTWMEGTSRSNREIYYARYENGKWTGKQKVYASAWNSTWPRIGVDQLNRPHIIWTHDLGSARGNNDIYHRWLDGSWKGPLDASRTKGTISIHANFFVGGLSQYALWMDGTESNWELMFNQNTNGSWATAEIVAPRYNGYWPGICADSYGNVHILFSSLLRSVYYINRIDGEWSKEQVVSSGSHERNFVYLDIDSDDVLHGAWRQTASGGHNIFYASGNRLGVWTNPEQVSNGSLCRTPIVKADNRGYVHIVWYEFHEEKEVGDVYYNRVDAGIGGSADAPVAILDYSPRFGAPPLKVLFDGSGSYDPDGNVALFEWDFGDGATGGGAKLFHTYSRRGTYKVTLTVRDNDGIPGQAQAEVVVSDPPVAQFTMNPEKGVMPLSVAFDASASNDPDGKIVAYQWDFGDGSTGSGRTINHVFTEDGNYPVMLEVTDDSGVSGFTTRTVEVVRVYPPTGLTWSFEVNRTLFTVEYLYALKWSPNPLNDQFGIGIDRYHVYRHDAVKGEDVLLAVVSANETGYLDRNLSADSEGRYSYQVTAVDSRGNESTPAAYGSGGNRADSLPAPGNPRRKN